MTDTYSLRRAALQTALEQLALQYGAALDQSISSPDDAIGVQAAQRLVGIERRMDALQQQLDRLPRLGAAEPGAGTPDPDGLHDYLRDKVHLVDFKSVQEALETLLAPTQGRVRGGLLLLRRCSEMNGRLCTSRVERTLRERTGRGRFRHYPIEFRASDRNDTAALLRHLGRHLNLDLADRSVDEQLARLSSTLCGSLQGGSIVLIQAGGCNRLVEDHPEALHWLVSCLWPRLLADLEAAAVRLAGPLTLIWLLLADDLADGHLDTRYRCAAGAFRRDLVLDLELGPWCQEDVEDWLACYGVPERYPPEATRRLAREIVAGARGNPLAIENALLNLCAVL